MNPTQKTIEAGGVSYTFRLPSQKDLIEIDIDALKMRGGLTEGLGMAVTYTQNVAMMQKLCISPEPEKVDFADLPSYVGDKIGRDLTAWVNSFSEPVGDKKKPVDK